MSMDRIIDSLPGVTMPVEEVTSTLTKMWDSLQQTEGQETETRASQLNLVVHFGLSTTSDEAKEIFDTAVTFAQEYPCRIIVLCPSGTATRDSGFEGKQYECTDCHDPHSSNVNKFLLLSDTKGPNAPCKKCHSQYF